MIYIYVSMIYMYIYKIYRTSYPGHIILPVISIWYIELVGRNSRNYYRRGCRLLRLWIATLRIVPWEIRIIVGISMESSLGLAPMVKYLHEVRELHPPPFFWFSTINLTIKWDISDVEWELNWPFYNYHSTESENDQSICRAHFDLCKMMRSHLKCALEFSQN